MDTLPRILDIGRVDGNIAFAKRSIDKPEAHHIGSGSIQLRKMKPS